MDASRRRQSAALYSSSINANCTLLMASMSFTPTHAPAKRARYVNKLKSYANINVPTTPATCLYVTVRHVTRSEGRLQPLNSWRARHHHIVRQASLTVGNAGSYSQFVCALGTAPPWPRWRNSARILPPSLVSRGLFTRARDHETESEALNSGRRLS